METAIPNTSCRLAFLKIFAVGDGACETAMTTLGQLFSKYGTHTFASAPPGSLLEMHIFLARIPDQFCKIRNWRGGVSGWSLNLQPGDSDRRLRRATLPWHCYPNIPVSRTSVVPGVLFWGTLGVCLCVPPAVGRRAEMRPPGNQSHLIGKNWVFLFGYLVFFLHFICFLN